VHGTIKTHMADDKLYKSVSMGSGTFLITKPKRKAAKRRQSALKHPRRGARK
jgi:preprotein translocase subunit YajC